MAWSKSFICVRVCVCIYSKQYMYVYLLTHIILICIRFTPTSDDSFLVFMAHHFYSSIMMHNTLTDETQQKMYRDWRSFLCETPVFAIFLLIVQVDFTTKWCFWCPNTCRTKFHKFAYFFVAPDLRKHVCIQQRIFFLPLVCYVTGFDYLIISLDYCTFIVTSCIRYIHICIFHWSKWS